MMISCFSTSKRSVRGEDTHIRKVRKQIKVIGWELNRQLRSPGRGCGCCCCSMRRREDGEREMVELEEVS